MTNKQELRMWGMMCLVGSCVATVSFSESKFWQVLGIVILYSLGMFLGTDLSVRYVEKIEKRQAEKNLLKGVKNESNK
jgi:hypothetical protein